MFASKPPVISHLQSTLKLWEDEKFGKALISKLTDHLDPRSAIYDRVDRLQDPFVADPHIERHVKTFVKDLDDMRDPLAESVSEFCLNEIFHKKLETVDFSRALEALDLIESFESYRFRVMQDLANLMGYNRVPWSETPRTHDEARTLVKDISEKEIEVDKYYGHVFKNLRYRIMVHNLLYEPFSKDKAIALLNTLYSTILPANVTTKLTKEVMLRDRSYLYRCICEICQQPSTIVYVHPHLEAYYREESDSGWVSKRSDLQKYFEIAQDMINNARKITELISMPNMQPPTGIAGSPLKLPAAFQSRSYAVKSPTPLSTGQAFNFDVDRYSTSGHQVLGASSRLRSQRSFHVSPSSLETLASPYGGQISHLPLPRAARSTTNLHAKTPLLSRTEVESPEFGTAAPWYQEACHSPTNLPRAGALLMGSPRVAPSQGSSSQKLRPRDGLGLNYVPGVSPETSVYSSFAPINNDTLGIMSRTRTFTTGTSVISMNDTSGITLGGPEYETMPLAGVKESEKKSRRFGLFRKENRRRKTAEPFGDSETEPSIKQADENTAMQSGPDLDKTGSISEDIALEDAVRRVLKEGLNKHAEDESQRAMMQTRLAMEKEMREEAKRASKLSNQSSEGSISRLVGKIAGNLGRNF